MFAWGIVTWAHAFIHGSKTYYVLRSFIAFTEAGVIPATLVYLGSFYTSDELATRLSWFWGVQSCASAVSGPLAAGILKIRGVHGLFGWKWLFIIEGIITNFVAILTLRVLLIGSRVRFVTNLIALMTALGFTFRPAPQIRRSSGVVLGYRPGNATLP